MLKFLPTLILFLFLGACSDVTSSYFLDEETVTDLDTKHSQMLQIYSKGKSTILSSSEIEEMPKLTVRFTYSFSLGTHEVTRKEFAMWTGKDIGDLSDVPMTNVTYFDAILAANARSKFEGLDTAYTYASAKFDNDNCIELSEFSFSPTSSGYRLPTEAEWTLAARSIEFVPENAWNRENSGDVLHPVCKSKHKTSLCDMAGNAMEWVNDWRGNFKDTTITNFIGAANGGTLGTRILKGGSFKNNVANINVYSRGDVYTVSSSTKADYVGFRLAIGSIPHSQFYNSYAYSTLTTATTVASAQEIKMKVGTTRARLAFRDDDQGRIVVVEYALGSKAIYELSKKGDPYHMSISPNGTWIAYTTSPEGISDFDTLYVQPFNAVDSSYFRYTKNSAAEPRWQINNGDTLIYFGSDGGDNSSTFKFMNGSTSAVVFQNKKFGKETEMFSGSYHGGVYDDKSLAVSGSKLLRARLHDKDTIWYNGEQACNVSLAKDTTKRTLFLDFGSKNGIEFVGQNYAAHEQILIADSLGKLIQAIPAPKGYTFDHTEWTSVPNLIIATLVNSEGRHSKIVLVDAKDSSILTLVEGRELWHPTLWVPQNYNRLPVDTTLAGDSLGVYMTETSSITSRIMKVKMDLFWSFRNYAQIAITGSSRSFSGVDPTLLTTSKNLRALNYSFSSQDMAATEYFAENYYLPLEKLKTLVIALDIDRWSFTDVTFKTLRNEVPGYLYDEHHDFWHKKIPAQMKKIVTDNISPEPYEYDIYCYHYGLYHSENSGYSQTPKLSFNRYDATAAEFNKKKLEHIIDLAQSYGVNVVGIIFPQSPLFIKLKSWGLYGPSLDDAQQLLSYLKNLSKNKSNFYILDEYKNGQHDYLSSEFDNDDHLNTEGAKKLTKRLDSLLQRIQ